MGTSVAQRGPISRAVEASFRRQFIVKTRREMAEMLAPLLVFGGWFLLMRWVLPRMGVPT